MERSMCSYFSALIGLLLLAGLIPACSNTHEYSGSPPVIDTQHNVIMLKASAGGVDDVRFRHQAHADYYNNTCMVCHSHTSARDTSIWSCSSCHAANDAQGLCGTTGDGHACMSAQCLKCHLQLNPNPTPLCTQCHITPLYGIFIDAPVKGLDYRTETQKGSTDAAGTFKYLPGETITFSVGTVVLGSAPAKPVMTPIDLVNGAVNETDPTVTNICRLLQTLDENGNPSDGIVIPIGAWNAIYRRDIVFTVPTASFGLQPDLVSFLSTLNSTSVFSNGTHTLVNEATAQANLRAGLDAFNPPASAVWIGGPLNTNFIANGRYSATAGQNYVFQWYSSSTNTGAGQAIAGATSTSYIPVLADVGKWLVFEVTPYNGGLYGTPVRSAWTGTISSAKTVTVYAALTSKSAIDKYSLRVQSAGTVSINIESYEPWNSTCSNFTCGSGCHLSPVYNQGPTNLLLTNGSTTSNNSCSNDRLITNAYLFSSTSGSLGALVSAKTGTAPCALAGNQTGWPGCDAPGAFTASRNGRNPFIRNPLVMGDYVLSVGSSSLSEADARSGTNSSALSSYFTSTVATPSTHGANGIYMKYGSNYRVIFTFP